MKHYFLPLLLATTCVGGYVNQGWAMETRERDAGNNTISQSMMNLDGFLNQDPKPLKKENLKNFLNIWNEKSIENSFVQLTEDAKNNIKIPVLNSPEEILNEISERVKKFKNFDNDINDVNKIYIFLAENNKQVLEMESLLTSLLQIPQISEELKKEAEFFNNKKQRAFHQSIDAFWALFSIIKENLKQKEWTDNIVNNLIACTVQYKKLITKSLKEKSLFGDIHTYDKIFVMWSDSDKDPKLTKIKGTLYFQKYFKNKKGLDQTAAQEIEEILNNVQYLDREFFASLTKNFFLFALKEKDPLKSKDWLMSAFKAFPGNSFIDFSYELLQDDHMKKRMILFLNEDMKNLDSTKTFSFLFDPKKTYSFLDFYIKILNKKNFCVAPIADTKNPAPMSDFEVFLTTTDLQERRHEMLFKIAYILEQQKKRKEAREIYAYLSSNHYLKADGRLSILELKKQALNPNEILKTLEKTLSYLPQNNVVFAGEIFDILKPFLKKITNTDDFFPFFYQILNHLPLKKLAISWFSQYQQPSPQAIHDSNEAFQYFAQLNSCKKIKDIKNLFKKKSLKATFADTTSQEKLFQMACIFEKLAENDFDRKKAYEIYDYLASQGNLDAAIRYGIVRLQTEDLWANFSEAHEFLKKLEQILGQKEDREGCWMLSQGFLKINKEEEGMPWLFKAINLGHPPAIMYGNFINQEIQKRKALLEPQTVLIIDPNQLKATQDQKFEEQKEPDDDIPDSQTVIGDDDTREMGEEEQEGFDDVYDGLSMAPSTQTNFTTGTQFSKIHAIEDDLKKFSEQNPYGNNVIISDKHLNAFENFQKKIREKEDLGEKRLAKIIAQKEHPAFKKCRDLAQSITKNTIAENVPGILKSIAQRINSLREEESKEVGVTVTYKKTESGYTFQCYNTIKGNLPTAEDNKTVSEHTHFGNKTFDTIEINYLARLKLLLNETFD